MACSQENGNEVGREERENMQTKDVVSATDEIQADPMGRPLA